jgi:hypothetical protein
VPIPHLPPGWREVLDWTVLAVYSLAVLAVVTCLVLGVLP